MSQLIDNFQTASITKRGNGSNAPAPTAASASAGVTSPEGLAFMRSPTFAKVRSFLLCRMRVSENAGLVLECC